MVLQLRGKSLFGTDLDLSEHVGFAAHATKLQSESDYPGDNRVKLGFRSIHPCHAGYYGIFPGVAGPVGTGLNAKRLDATGVNRATV